MFSTSFSYRISRDGRETGPRCPIAINGLVPQLNLTTCRFETLHQRICSAVSMYSWYNATQNYPAPGSSLFLDISITAFSRLGVLSPLFEISLLVCGFQKDGLAGTISQLSCQDFEGLSYFLSIFEHCS